jgi:hypothetical protein
MSRIMIRVMRGNRALLLLCTFLVASLIGMGISCTQNRPSKDYVTTVSSFESQNDLRQLKVTDCKASLTTENVTNGQPALKVEFSNPETATVDLSSETKAWDWREYGAAAVDVANPSNEEIQVGMQLDMQSLELVLAIGRLNTAATERPVRRSVTTSGLAPVLRLLTGCAVAPRRWREYCLSV